MSRLITAAILLAAAALFLLWSGWAAGQTLTPFKAAVEAKRTQRWPSWVTVDDTLRLVTANNRVYGCITDGPTGARHAGWTPQATWTAFLQRGTWTFSAPAPTTSSDFSVCWPSPQVVGDPVYNFIAYTAGQGSPIKWGVMDQLGVERDTLPGETCGAKLDWIPTEHDDPKVAWHAMREGGMTRCRAP